MFFKVFITLLFHEWIPFDQIATHETPTAVTFTPATNCSIGLGGAFKVGKVVFINLRVDTSAAITNGVVGTFSQVPKKATGFTKNNLIAVTVNGRDTSNNNLSMYGYINADNGKLSIYGTGSLNTPVGYFMVTGFYAIS